MSVRYNSLFQFMFSFFDLLILNLVFFICKWLTDKVPDAYDKAYVVLFIAYNVGWLLSSGITSLYIHTNYLKYDVFAKRSINAFLVFLGSIFLFIFLYHFSYSRVFVIISISSFGIVLLLSRALFIWSGNYISIHEKFIRKVIILGYNEKAKKLAEYFLYNNKNVQIAGYFEDAENVQELSVFPIIGQVKECLDYSINNEISEIYSTLSPNDYGYLFDLAEKAENNFIRFKFVPDFNLFTNRDLHLSFIENFPILSLRSQPLDDLGNRFKKRAFDAIVSSLVIIFILSWLIPLIGILIFIESPGPIFFLQLRTGKNNKKFYCIKFRSMKPNRESDIKQATRNDERITRFGMFLRKTSLDEFPQFFNVFKGDMSTVGPRPHMIKHTDDYSKLVNEYMVRQFLKPGITGWAQINGYRGEIKERKQVQKRVEYDLWYLENWSLWLDLKIILLTIPTMFKHK